MTALVLTGCATVPVPTGTPVPTASPTAQPSPEPTSSTAPWVACGPVIEYDSTGRLQSCEDLGPVAADSVAPHLANHRPDLSGLRVWWHSPSCVSTWHLDIHETSYGVTLEILDDGQDCSGESVGRAVDLDFYPAVLAADLTLMHNGNLIVTLPPAPTPQIGRASCRERV